jgi:hypothetical protein
VLILLVVASGVGCMSLTKKGATVRVITGDPANECTEVGTVRGYGLGTDPQGYEYAKNDLRESAAEKGATHVRIENQGRSAIGDTEISGTAYRCPNPAPPAEID